MNARRRADDNEARAQGTQKKPRRRKIAGGRKPGATRADHPAIALIEGRIHEPATPEGLSRKGTQGLQKPAPVGSWRPFTAQHIEACWHAHRLKPNCPRSRLRGRIDTVFVPPGTTCFNTLPHYLNPQLITYLPSSITNTFLHNKFRHLE